MDLGSKISICRQNKNMTQEELAKRLGVTPQAISMWERNTRMPDISLLASLCEVLGVSADYMLGLSDKNIISDSQVAFQHEILSNLRNSLEPLELLIGENLVSMFEDGSFKTEIDNVRLRLSTEGILMPVLKIRDYSLMKDNQFMILSYQNVLYDECVDNCDLKHIINKLEIIVRDKYAEIINPDIIKNLVDNLRLKYPALIENVVPEKISYGLLTKVLKNFMRRGNGIIYLPRIIECMQYALLDGSKRDIGAWTEIVSKYIENENNFWVYCGRNMPYCS